MRKHVGVVVGRANGEIGIAGLNGTSRFAVHGFVLGPKIDVYPERDCRAYRLEDVCTHFAEYCEGIQPAGGAAAEGAPIRMAGLGGNPSRERQR